VRGTWAAPVGQGNAADAALVALKNGSGNYYDGEQCLYPLVPTAGHIASRAVSDSLADLWTLFSRDGGLDVSSPSVTTPDGGTASGRFDGGYGAVVVNVSRLASGETTVLRVVLAWHHPNRFHFGSLLGNRYTATYAGALAAATAVGRSVDTVVANIQRWHGLIFSTDLPVDWKDFLVNSMAALAKTSMWFGDGSWRQFESFSDDDPDPVHIHLYRSLPYAAFFPELDRSLLSGAYALWQNRTSGYVRAFALLCARRQHTIFFLVGARAFMLSVSCVDRVTTVDRSHFMRARTHTHAHTRAHTHTHTNTNTCTHHTHTHTHAHTHTHTHTHHTSHITHHTSHTQTLTLTHTHHTLSRVRADGIII
jgi:hypothetical protein